jgi:hypothetical protein
MLPVHLLGRDIVAVYLLPMTSYHVLKRIPDCRIILMIVFIPCCWVICTGTGRRCW